MDFIDYERKAYNSKRYAQRHWHRKRVKETLEALGNANRLLDIGCGSGILIEHANANCVIGIDTDKETLILNKKRDFGKKVFFVVADATMLPFKNNSFDAVSSTEVIEHVEGPDVLVKEISRTLFDTGKLVITTPNYRSTWPLVENVWSKFSDARDYTECHVSHFSGRRLRKLLERNGLLVKSKRTIHSIVMLNRAMTKIFGPLDYILTRLGLGMVMIFLAEKQIKPSAVNTDTVLASKE